MQAINDVSVVAVSTLVASEDPNVQESALAAVAQLSSTSGSAKKMVNDGKLTGMIVDAISKKIPAGTEPKVHFLTRWDLLSGACGHTCISRGLSHHRHHGILH